MTEPIWLSMMRLVEGLNEIPGPLSEPVIMKWAKDIGAPGYVNDDMAWCAVCMNRIMLASQQPMAGTGYDLLRAWSFETWGRECVPTLGAIMVFNRPGGSHVGEYLGERSDAYYVIGGNTGNAVAATWIAKERLTACRWALDVTLPINQRVFLTADGRPVSVNEA